MSESSEYDKIVAHEGAPPIDDSALSQVTPDDKSLAPVDLSDSSSLESKIHRHPPKHYPHPKPVHIPHVEHTDDSVIDHKWSKSHCKAQAKPCDDHHWTKSCDGCAGYDPAMWGQQPFTCVQELIRKYGDCNVSISQEKRTAAFEAFSRATGYQSPDLDALFDNINFVNETIINFNSGFMYGPILFLIWVIIWTMVWFGWFNWVVGLFMSSFALVILYGSSVLYRVTARLWLNENYDNIQQNTQILQDSFENSVAYWVQGLLAAACAVTCEDPESPDCWSCGMNNRCPPRQHHDHKPKPKHRRNWKHDKTVHKSTTKRR